ncbi:isocitrate lyase [Cryobacterium breve]|uniref:Isocitrate lyase n=1 Tax=Cryobacterium breve TaxID=1259258 RepID=A0ABY7NGC1_9MICO|nr:MULTISPECIES: isocitrate lyase [Cryobacterium]MDY7541687.1 isocitrate lyase [Cryobacterium sp. 5B3]MEA9999644.1 isocitrate lyase [Cryobacterium sp. RTS3]MEB0266464.1 isocitrate lyase [Cryobacterium sp. 10I5]MEB0275459.1 isocitrate lyase [Cryobacterium sp. 5B3]WBM81279.1 isocitrate lyase [Cryobacterium breve]
MTENAARPGDQTQTAAELALEWAADARWNGIRRDYTAEDVISLRGSVREDRTLARRGAENLWNLIHQNGTAENPEWVRALGALTGNQAVQQVRAGLKAIYLSGWQVAADANLSGQTYPDQSLYPANSVPSVVRRINNALLRADQIESSEAAANGGAGTGIDWLAPIVADAEAGFGGPLNAYELMQSMIEAGAAGVHWEDQLASEKKCGHMGGKVLVPTGQHIRTLNAARLAADVAGVPTIIIARTDSLAATLITSDIDERDQEFLTGGRTAEGFYDTQNGIDVVIARGLAYAPYADLLWVESSEPDLELAQRFAAEIHAQFPGKKLAYNCSPSFNWKSHLNDAQIEAFQRELAKAGYAFQFITLAGFHALNHSMFTLAKDYSERQMSAYVELQEAEFASEADGYTATRHQREVGTGYFDKIATALNPNSATLALVGSTEAEQF